MPDHQNEQPEMKPEVVKALNNARNHRTLMNNNMASQKVENRNTDPAAIDEEEELKVTSEQLAVQNKEAEEKKQQQDKANEQIALDMEIDNDENDEQAELDAITEKMAIQAQLEQKEQAIEEAQLEEQEQLEQQSPQRMAEQKENTSEVVEDGFFGLKEYFDKSDKPEDVQEQAPAEPIVENKVATDLELAEQETPENEEQSLSDAPTFKPPGFNQNH